jgi:hypothetical protein
VEIITPGNVVGVEDKNSPQREPVVLSQKCEAATITSSKL